MFTGLLFRRGMDGNKWITCVNLNTSSISKDGHGSKRHQILLAYLRPGVIKSLGTKQAWLTESC